jgi:hypothetical protein
MAAPLNLTEIYLPDYRCRFRLSRKSEPPVIYKLKVHRFFRFTN